MSILEHNTSEIANFFWHGTLTNFEKSCIKSFVRHGWIVQLWSYTGLNVDGAIQKDAREVLPEDHLFKYNQHGLVVDNDQAHTTLAAFSDVFRYHLLEQERGWWFDCDCFCLKNVKEYAKLKDSLGLIVGVMYPEPRFGIGTGALYLNKQLAQTMIDIVNNSGAKCDNQFGKWAEIGPELVENVLIENGDISKALPLNTFYAIHWDEFDLLVKPENISIALRRTKNSLMIHAWDTVIKLRGYDKNDLPRGSFLDHLCKL